MSSDCEDISIRGKSKDVAIGHVLARQTSYVNERVQFKRRRDM